MRGSLGGHLPLVAFLTLTFMGGGNPVGVRISNRELAPLWGAGLRFLIAALLMWTIVLSFRIRVPRRRDLVPIALYGALQYGAAYALVYWGFLSVPAGLGQTIMGVIPLATVLLAAVAGQETLNARGSGGALLALAGIAVMVGPRGHSNLPPLSVIAVILGAVCVAQATVLARALPKHHPVAINSVAMTVGAGLLVAGSLVLGEPMALPVVTATWLALGYLALLGSVAMFSLYLVVLRYWSASKVSYAFVIFPGWAILLSAWLDAEPLTLSLLVGATITLVGVMVGKGGVGGSKLRSR